MNWNSYIDAAQRTAGTHRSTDYALTHAALGICGEVGELCDHFRYGEFGQSIADEMGDVLWYCALAADALDAREFPKTQWPHGSSSAKDMSLSLYRSAASFSEMVKKQVMHSRDTKAAMIASLMDIVSGCEYVCRWYGIEFESVLNGNIEKLLKRYPNGFTA